MKIRLEYLPTEGREAVTFAKGELPDVLIRRPAGSPKSKGGQLRGLLQYDFRLFEFSEVIDEDDGHHCALYVQVPNLSIPYKT